MGDEKSGGGDAEPALTTSLAAVGIAAETHHSNPTNDTDAAGDSATAPTSAPPNAPPTAPATGLVDSMMGGLAMPSVWGLSKIGDMAGAAFTEVGEKFSEVADGIVDKIEHIGDAPGDESAGIAHDSAETTRDPSVPDPNSEMGQVWSQVKDDLDKATHWASDMIKEAIDVVADVVDGDEPQHTIGDDDEDDDFAKRAEPHPETTETPDT